MSNTEPVAVDTTTETTTEETTTVTVKLPRKTTVLKYTAAALAGAGLTALAYKLREDDETEADSDVIFVEAPIDTTDPTTD